jgi:hypothetical protein
MQRSKRQTSSFRPHQGTAEVATSEVRRLCLPAIDHVSLPTCDRVSSPAAFRIRSAGCSMEASMMQSAICHSHVGRPSALLVQVSPDQGTERMSSSPRRKGAHRGLTPTRNSSAAKPGSSQLRRREAFLRLARSQRMEGMPRPKPLLSQSLRSIAVRDVMVRRRGKGAELEFMLVSQPIQLTQEE